MNDNCKIKKIDFIEELYTKDICSVAIYIAKLGNIKFLFVEFEKGNDIGTIGIKEAEKIIKGFDYATKNKYPIITYVLSGGIRVQEGFKAVVQIINVISAINKHNEQGLLYISIVRKPTFGGTSIGIVALADIIVFEDDAIFGFAGRKIIENTYKENIKEIRTSKFWDECGFADIVTNKKNLANILEQILTIHGYNNEKQKL